MTQQAIQAASGTIEGLRQSRIGKRTVDIPKGVTVTIKDGTVDVKGPKGQLSRALPQNVSVKIEGAALTVLPTIPGRDGARFQGLARALINTMVVGTSTGYTKTLQLVGTGYRAELKGQVLNLSLGFSHPVNFPIPAGIKVEIPGDSKGTLVVLTGADKEKMGETAAKIRGFRPPEPYGGKGVRYQGEKVREKAGKAGAKGGK
ncbi:50S ribosomal protein L6 [Pendulispora albinea]|uniref:Large ribosomal subunit protein uL6 n=1 Tax=Pendulispora albinea TaxID=2741071 RepID=A0ABZ2M5N1_9BACT